MEKEKILVSSNIQLRAIDHENATMLFPLFKADLKEISQWFPFDEDYKLEYDLSYVDEKTPPFDETFVIYYNGKPCGRVGLYDYDQRKGEIYLYYWVASPFRRKHIAIASVLAVMDHLRSLGLKDVLFDVKKGNEYSISLIEQLPNAVLLKDEADGLIYGCQLQ
ncbi:MAG: GNAT family N-acetyltransferase [Lachnospiraceae bacterium]|nr:GNAT family N-acetyltransferase [Lachnospiraceae bacterium]